MSQPPTLACAMPDLAAVRGFLRTACDPSVALESLEATYVRAGAAGPARLLYEMRGRHGDVVRLAARRVDAARGRSSEETINARWPSPPRSTGFTRAALYAPALDLLFQVFPADDDLPSLRLAVDESAVVAVLHVVLADRRAGTQLTSVTAHVVRYKPGRKCLLRYDLAWAAGGRDLPRVVWARVSRRPKFERTHGNLPRIHAAAAGIGFDLPEPLGVAPGVAMEFFGPVRGSALCELTDRDDFPLLCRRVGERLRRFHALRVELDEVFDGAAQAERLAENAAEFAWMLPAEANRIAAFEREINARLHTTDPPGSRAPLGLIHRDFHGGNILVADGRYALVDFEDCAMGEAADDVGSHWAQLWWHGHRTPGRSARLAAARRAFLDGYLETADPSTVSRLPTYAAMHCFLRAHQCLRHPQDGARHNDALAMLVACEHALDGDLA